MTRNPSIRGSRPQALPRASQQHPEGRVCAFPTCDTRLSKYNRRDRCWAHAEMKIPRLRGRNPASGSV